MFHLEPAVGPDPLVLEGLHAGPCLVLVRVDDQADAAAHSGGGAHFQAALDREGAIKRSKVQVGELYCRLEIRNSLISGRKMQFYYWLGNESSCVSRQENGRKLYFCREKY